MFVAGFYEIQRALVDLQLRGGEQSGATVSGRCKSGNDFITPLPLRFNVFWQVFMKFSEPWWTFSREKGNRAVPILFGNFTDGRKAGATGVTDNKMAQVTSPFKWIVSRDE
jgi:hypothetical protein